MLLVDDDEDDYVITRDMLERQDRVRFTVEWAAGLRAARWRRSASSATTSTWSTTSSGSAPGLELMREGFASRPFAPVIMLTGQATYEIDLEATALGRHRLPGQAGARRRQARALDPLRDQPPEGPRALRAGGARRQRRHLGLGPGRPTASTSRPAGTRSSASPRRRGDERALRLVRPRRTRRPARACATRSTRTSTGRTPASASASTGCATPTAAGAGS